MEEAIELYRRRVELGGWDEEVFYAAYQAGVLTARVDPEAAVPLLTDAYELRPSRAEPLRELARLSRLSRRYEAAYLYAKRGVELEVPADILFVHRDAYEWGMAFELAIAAYWTGRHDEALEVLERLLDDGRLPGDIERVVRQEPRVRADGARRGRAEAALAGREPRVARSAVWSWASCGCASSPIGQRSTPRSRRTAPGSG